MPDSTSRFPVRPSLEQLSKQAKELLRQVRAGELAALDRFGADAARLPRAQVRGKCLRLPVTREFASAAWAHSRKTSSSGSEQARTVWSGRTQKPFSRMASSVQVMTSCGRCKRGQLMTSSYSA